MKKIIHLTDLHFGTEKPELTALLVQDCLDLYPDLIVISGDLTQRATEIQYQAVQDFLNHFQGITVLCVPGNHDISLYNLIERFTYPFSKYKKWVSSSLCASYTDDKLAVLGVNSVTPYKSMGGYVTNEQLNLVKNFFNAQPASIIKIIVMHHNLIKSERHKIINDADKIINVFANAGVNLVLSGHIHYPWVEKIKKEYLKKDLYIITAGTPISWRTSVPNSYNVIEIGDNSFSITVRYYTNQQFISEEEKIFSF